MNERTAYVVLFIFGKVIGKKSVNWEGTFTSYIVTCCNVSPSLVHETEEPMAKRTKLSGTDENFHRDDPQIGVCLECLGYVSCITVDFNVIFVSFLTEFYLYLALN